MRYHAQRKHELLDECPQYRATLFRRIHRLWCTVLHKHIMPGTVDFFKLFLSFHQLVGLYLTWI
jgi:hypothetical protein